MKTLDIIKNLGVKPGITLNPSTELEKILPYVEKVELVQFMTVNPGFSGQKFIPEVLPKIKELRTKYPDLDIEIDGGINSETAPLAKEAGVNIFCASSYIFKADDKVAALKKLREIVE